VNIKEQKKKVQEIEDTIISLKLELKKATEEHKEESSDLKELEIERDTITKEKSINEVNNLKRKRKETRDYLDSLRDYRPDDDEGYCEAIKKNNKRCNNRSKFEKDGYALCSKCY